MSQEEKVPGALGFPPQMPQEEKAEKKEVKVSAGDVRDLRARSGAGILDAKKALIECEGDADKAMEPPGKSWTMELQRCFFLFHMCIYIYIYATPPPPPPKDLPFCCLSSALFAHRGLEGKISQLGLGPNKTRTK